MTNRKHFEDNNFNANLFNDENSNLNHNDEQEMLEGNVTLSQTGEETVAIEQCSNSENTNPEKLHLRIGGMTIEERLLLDEIGFTGIRLPSDDPEEEETGFWKDYPDEEDDYDDYYEDYLRRSHIDFYDDDELDLFDDDIYDDRTWGQKRGLCHRFDNCYGCPFASECFD